MNQIFTLCVALLLVAVQSSKLKVMVTGAGGRTGSIVFRKLLASETFSPVAVVRSSKSNKALKKIGASDSQIVVADVTNEAALQSAFSGAHAVILCTSATPKIKPLSILKVFLAKLFRKEGVRPQFTFPTNGAPYYVDWLGAKNQIDAAKAAAVNQFVFVSSMGGTQPENFLNTIGRVEGDDKSGNILLWKRKAEEYLIKSGLAYTILHPGGLTDKPGGKSQIILDVDDALLTRKVRSIPREDVAEVCVQALQQVGAQRRSIDIIADPVANPTELTTDWKLFFSKPGNCKY